MSTTKTGKVSQIKMSFDDYDTMVEKFDKLGYRPEWPDATLIDELEENIKKNKTWMKFCCFIAEKAAEPETENDKESKKKILELINKYLVLEESE